MCGIAGIVNIDRASPVEAGHILAMTRCLVHRGPDDEGVYVDQNVGLGNRRLAIVDLSPAGRQPMCNEDRTVWVTFNGEIYNARALSDTLRNKGHRFKSRSDTEAIVHAYEQYGIGFLQSLDGMFGLGVWDGKTRTLVLARDPVGKKPIYYYFDGRKMMFASEMRSLLWVGFNDMDLEIDQYALNQFLIFGHFPAPYTIYKKIRKLSPGHYLTLKDDVVDVRRFWDVRFEPDGSYDEESALDEFDGLLRDSVRKRLVGDVPVGAFLSGGVDSSCVVGMASKLANTPVKTFSIGFEDEVHDETRYARQVAEYFGTDHNEIIIGGHDLSDDITRIMGSFDEPFYDDSAIPTSYVSGLARRDVTVALSGDGGDELFLGYLHHVKLADRYSRLARVAGLPRGVGEQAIAHLPELLLKYISRSYDLASRILPGDHDRPELIDKVKDRLAFAGYRDWADYYVLNRGRTPRYLRAALLKDSRAFVDESSFLRDIIELESQSDPIVQLAAADFRNYLPNDILTKVDRMSMQHSLEVRVPLLDRSIVEFAARLPTALKLRGGNQKYLLKRYLESRLIPDPDVLESVTRPKHGFRFPLGRYIHGSLKGQIYESCRASGYRDAFGISPRGVESALAAYYEDGRGGRTIWMLFCLSLWWERNRGVQA